MGMWQDFVMFYRDEKGNVVHYYHVATVNEFQDKETSWLPLANCHGEFNLNVGQLSLG